jgi:hypothetical protein
MPDEKADDRAIANIWVISNRVDDRVVLFERDPAHPNGEAFIGGAGPDLVARNATIEELLRTNQIVMIPEPPDGPKKPITTEEAGISTPSNQPGQPTRLGRVMDPDLVPASAMKAVQAQQTRSEVPVPAGTIVPPDPGSHTERRGGGGR